MLYYTFGSLWDNVNISLDQFHAQSVFPQLCSYSRGKSGLGKASNIVGVSGGGMEEGGEGGKDKLTSGADENARQLNALIRQTQSAVLKAQSKSNSGDKKIAPGQHLLPTLYDVATLQLNT